ncbi:unnamed protein product, partial [Rotaria sp. Silwood2]
MDSFVYIYFYFSCNFETNFCKFTSLSYVQPRFERARADQLIHDYAPERDHTLNNLAGSFIYVNTLGQTPNSIAQLKSSRFIPTTGCKVRFYYYMNSATNPGQLTFMVRNQTQGLTTNIWSISKVSGDHWERQGLLLPTGSVFELLMEV